MRSRFPSSSILTACLCFALCAAAAHAQERRLQAEGAELYYRNITLTPSD